MKTHDRKSQHRSSEDRTHHITGAMEMNSMASTAVKKGSHHNTEAMKTHSQKSQHRSSEDRNHHSTGAMEMYSMASTAVKTALTTTQKQ